MKIASEECKNLRCSSWGACTRIHSQTHSGLQCGGDSSKSTSDIWGVTELTSFMARARGTGVGVLSPRTKALAGATAPLLRLSPTQLAGSGKCQIWPHISQANTIRPTWWFLKTLPHPTCAPSPSTIQESFYISSLPHLMLQTSLKSLKILQTLNKQC